MPVTARGRSAGARYTGLVEILHEFLTASRTGAANLHIIPILFLFHLISMTDVLTTVAFLSLGGMEGNVLLRQLMGAYGVWVLLPYKGAIVGIVGATIVFFWKGLGVQPRRFFWPLIVMTLVTVSIVLSNTAYILNLL